jgi:multiple sugar transport system substrate-binding protein
VDRVVTPPTDLDVDAEALFIQNKVGMLINGRWYTAPVRNNARFNWNVEEMPRGKANATWLFWETYVVNKSTADPTAAWQVLKEITRAEAMVRVAQTGASIPARKDQSAIDAFLAAQPPQNNLAFLEGIPYATAEIPFWTGSWSAYIDDIVQPEVSNVLAGRITAEDFGKEIRTKTNPVFKK